MSVRIMHLVWEYDCPSGDKIVLLKLADCGNDQGENIYPKIETIAKACGCSNRHVSRAISKYVENGVLTVDEPGGGRGRPTVYTLHPDQLNHDTHSMNTCQTMTSTTLNHDTESVNHDTDDIDTIYRKSDEPLGNRVGLTALVVSLGFEDLVPLSEKYEKHRKENHWTVWKSTTVESMSKSWRKFSKHQVETAIQTSIEKGWRAIFPEKVPPETGSFEDAAARNLELLEGM